MPRFGRTTSGGEAQTWEPEAAAGRLSRTAGADTAGVFTSDLSVSEYVLLGEAGFEPLGFVEANVHARLGHLTRRIGPGDQWSPFATGVSHCGAQ